MSTLEEAFMAVAVLALRYESLNHHDSDILKVLPGGNYKITVGLLRAIRRWISLDLQFGMPKEPPQEPLQSPLEAHFERTFTGTYRGRALDLKKQEAIEKAIEEEEERRLQRRAGGRR